MWNYTILQLSKSDVLLKLFVFDVQAIFYYFENFKTFQVECQCLSKACTHAVLQLLQNILLCSRRKMQIKSLFRAKCTFHDIQLLTAPATTLIGHIQKGTMTKCLVRSGQSSDTHLL